MKSVSLAVSLESTADEGMLETALGVPGVLAVLVDRRSSSIRVLAATSAAAEIARSALRPWTFN